MCSFTLQAESPSEQLHGRYQAWMHWPMDGLVIVGSMGVIMVWAWMHWPMDGFGAWMHWPMDGLVAWTLSWFGHGWQAKVGAMQT